MGRRGNGEGSITRHTKSGLYMARYTMQTATGPKRKTIYGKTRREVDEKLTKAKADRDNGLVFDADNLKLSDYLRRWLEDSVKDTVRQRTYERYEQIVRVHLKPVLGRIKLKTLTPAHVRGLYREKLDSGLAPRTVNYIHTTLHKALKQAVADGIIPRNVTEAVKAPKPEKKEVRPLSPEQARAFLRAAHGDRLEALYVLAVSTGMREGELLGLRWDDIDLKSGKLSVQRSLTITKDGPSFTPTKRSKSRRSIKLTIRAIEALKHHKAAQNEQRLELGSLWHDHGLIFTNQSGKSMHPWVMTTSFKKILKKANLPDITFHAATRHTAATLLFGKGTHPKLVQELLGHATISITLDTYSHVLPGMGDQTAAAMDAVLS
jgi:integrase